MQQDRSLDESAAVNEVQRLVNSTTTQKSVNAFAEYLKFTNDGVKVNCPWDAKWFDAKIEEQKQLHEVELRRKYYGYPDSPLRRR